MAFDIESTGVDPVTDRIVTASVVRLTPGQDPRTTTWLADPGVPIPITATEVHGITTERAQAEGRPAAEVVREVLDCLDLTWCTSTPVVAFNASYDLTMLHHESIRHGYGPLLLPGPVIDPLVIDRAVDRYRKGSRKLGAVCAHYGVELGAAHSADADALAAARVAWKIAQRYPDVAEWSLQELHARQTEWHADWAEGFEDYLRRVKRRDGEDEAVIASVHIDRSWPMGRAS